jgi:hypothetical protein
MVNIFITGATGYIGGDTLYELYNKHPEYSYTALVRTAEKGKSVTDKFPKVKTVQGDNDSSDLLKEEASKADIVIREFLLLIGLSSILTTQQIPQMPLITKEPLNLLLKVLPLATAPPNLATGFTPEAPVS